MKSRSMETRPPRAAPDVRGGARSFGERGSAILAVEKLVDAVPNPQARPVLPRATRGVWLFVDGDEQNVVPGLQLEDGSVLALTWSQVRTMVDEMAAWLRIVVDHTPRAPEEAHVSWEMPT